MVMILGVITILSGCADVQNVKSCLVDHEYGFWGGLWHGMIAGFSFIGSLFSDDIAVYARNNNGGWYDLGFVLGTGSLGAVISWIFGSSKN